MDVISISLIPWYLSLKILSSILEGCLLLWFSFNLGIRFYRERMVSAGPSIQKKEIEPHRAAMEEGLSFIDTLNEKQITHSQKHRFKVHNVIAGLAGLG